MLSGLEFPSGRLWLEQKICLGLMTGVYWLTVRSREHIQYGVVVGSNLIERRIGLLVVVPSWCMKKLNEHSRKGANHF